MTFALNFLVKQLLKMHMHPFLKDWDKIQIVPCEIDIVFGSGLLTIESRSEHSLYCRFVFDDEVRRRSFLLLEDFRLFCWWLYLLSVEFGYDPENTFFVEPRTQNVIRKIVLARMLCKDFIYRNDIKTAWGRHYQLNTALRQADRLYKELTGKETKTKPTGKNPVDIIDNYLEDIRVMTGN